MDICLECIEDEDLRNLIINEANNIHCYYCDNDRRGISMQKLADIVDDYLRKYISIGRYLYPDERQEGDQLKYLLQEELGIDYDPAVDLVEILEKSDSTYDDDRFYTSEESYLRKNESSGKYHETWESFTNRIKHQRRFFDPTIREQLSAILGEPNSDKAKELPCIEIGPDTKIKSLFRARLAGSEKDAKKILDNPKAELCPPPPALARAGRMNPAGISVFYGALSEDTTIAEVRPSVGGLAVVGTFAVSRKLRLLSLPKIDEGFTGSIFHADYEDRLARLRFFKIFHKLITKPIQPHEELIEYIPTQAVAEYVANVLQFDGILYASVQEGSLRVADDCDISDDEKELELHKSNIVLFGDAAIVKQAKTEKDIYTSSGTLTFEENSAYLVKVDSVKYTHRMTPIGELLWDDIIY